MIKNLITKFIKSTSKVKKADEVPASINLRILKLNNGDELIGKLVDNKNFVSVTNLYNTEDLIFIKDPMIIQNVYVEDSNAYVVKMRQWIPSSDCSIFPIRKESVLTITDAGKTILTKYNLAFFGQFSNFIMQ